MKHSIRNVVLAVVIAFGLAACSPEEIAIYKSLNPQQQEAVLNHLKSPAPAAASATPYGVWDRLAQCESHGEWNYGPHSNWGSKIYHGGLQFHPKTWSAHKLPGYPAYAYQATREQQIEVGKRVLAAQGWGAWPHCSRKLGLR